MQMTQGQRMGGWGAEQTQAYNMPRSISRPSQSLRLKSALITFYILHVLQQASLTYLFNFWDIASAMANTALAPL